MDIDVPVNKIKTLGNNWVTRLAGICLVVIFVINLTGCVGQDEVDESTPFYEDRVATVRIVMSEEDWEYMQANARAEEYATADFWLDDELVSDVAVRPKGNSSLMSVAQSGTSRMSLKVDFNFFNSARTLYGLKKVNLNNGFSDPTLIREVLSYELFEEMGMPTPRSSFVDVWVNDTHLGLYTMVEQVDKTFITNHFTDSNGNLYKPETQASALNWTAENLPEDALTDSGGDDEDINLGGGKLADIMQALGLEEATEEKEVAVVGFPQGQPGDMPVPDMQGLLDTAIKAAAELGINEEELINVLGDPAQGLPDLVAAAEKLGISEESLREALGFTAEGMPFGGMPSENVTQRDRPFQRMPFGDMPSGNFTRGEMRFGRMDLANMPSANVTQRALRAGGGQPGGMMGASGNLIEQMGLKTNENKADHSAVLRLLDVLNNEPDETFQEQIEKVLDVDQVLRYIAVSTVLVHLDNYTGMGHNYYLYEIDGKFTIIPWDLNMSFGNFNSGLDHDGIINFLIDEPTAGAVADRPLVGRLLAVPEYLDTYHGYLTELIDGPFSYEVMAQKIDKLADLIRPYVEADTLKFYSTAEFERALSDDVATTTRMSGMGLNIGLKAFVAERVDSIKKQLAGELPSTNNGQGNGGNSMMIGMMNR